MQARPPFPRVISNTLRTAFTTCPQKFNLEWLHHWKPKTTSIHLHAGKAFAKGMEHARKAYYVEGFDREDAIAAGWLALVHEYGQYATTDDDIKTVNRMAGALLYYFDIFAPEADFVKPCGIGESKGIEVSFVLPLPIAHPETGDPILIGGRFDMLGVHTNGAYYIVDEKTASQLGAQWINGWILDSQITEYIWACRTLDIPVEGAIFRGIAILKNSYGHAQAIQQRSKYLIDLWYKQLLRDIQRMIDCWKDGYFDYNLASGCKSYGGCVFRDVCSKQASQRWLEADFEVRPYQPYEHLVKV